jgi:hypothetical protein
MTEQPAEAERNVLCAMLLMMAAARETAPEAERDARYVAAADSIRQIAATMDQIGDDVVLKLFSVNETSEGLLSELISAMVTEVGFALPLYQDAAGFFQPLVERVDQILRKARPHMH